MPQLFDIGLSYGLIILIALVKFLFSKSLLRGKILTFFFFCAVFKEHVRVYIIIPADFRLQVCFGYSLKTKQCKILARCFDLEMSEASYSLMSP